MSRFASAMRDGEYGDLLGFHSIDQEVRKTSHLKKSRAVRVSWETLGRFANELDRAIQLGQESDCGFFAPLLVPSENALCVLRSFGMEFNVAFHPSFPR